MMFSKKHNHYFGNIQYFLCKTFQARTITQLLQLSGRWPLEKKVEKGEKAGS